MRLSSPILRTSIPLAAALALGVGFANAQVIDRGTFHLTVNGTAVATEEFEVRKSGSGAAVLTGARGKVTFRNGRTIETSLWARGPELTVNDYRASIAGDERRMVVLGRVGNRLEARTSAEWGEELREYRASPATVLLEEDIAHHYFLLASLVTDQRTSVHAISPLTEAEAELPVISRTDETITLGGERVGTTKIRIGAGDAARELWFDSAGRLMRLSVPARGFLAERLPGT